MTTQPFAKDLEEVFLEDMAVTMHVGATAWERHPDHTQTLLVSVTLFRHKARCGQAGLEDCLDYDRIASYVLEDWPKRPHTDLLETLAEDLADHCLADSRVEACTVTLRKPLFYRGAGTPGVRLHRARG